MAFIVVLPPILLVVVVVIVASDLFLPLLFALPQQQQSGVTSASESYLTHIVKYPVEHNLFSKVLVNMEGGLTIFYKSFIEISYNVCTPHCQPVAAAAAVI